MAIIDALRRIDRPSSRFLVNFVGVGESAEELYDRAEILGIQDRLVFWGRVPNEDIETIFASTDVQLLSSIWPENQPVSITEAMATRTAVIASASGGTGELVAHGESGFLVEPGNAEDLAERMRFFIDRPEQAAAFGERGFERIADCSFDSQVAKLLALYTRSCEAAECEPYLVVCSGVRFDRRFVELINTSPAMIGSRDLRFVMSEWLDDKELQQASVFLHLGGPLESRVQEAAAATRNPVLIPSGEQDTGSGSVLTLIVYESPEVAIAQLFGSLGRQAASSAREP